MQENYPVLVAVNPLRRKFKQLERIPIEREEFTIGRKSKSSAVIRDYDGISKRHCIIKKLNRTEWEIEVLSTRKIRVNTKKLKKGKVYKLKHDDIIQLDDAGDFVYKFINNVQVEDDCERPRKRRRHNNEAPNEVRSNSLTIASNENPQDTDQPESSNKQSEPGSASSWTEKEMAKRVQDLVSNFAVQIEKLKGEGSQTRPERGNKRNAQLSVVKRQMEDKICAEIMGPLKEISKLKDNLLKKQEEFIEKLNSHESSKYRLQQELRAKIQEHAQDRTEKEKLRLDLEEVNSQLKSVETEKEALEKINTAAKHATLIELGETMENELQCIICAGMFVGATTLGCSHMFCEFCIGQWKKKKNECPLCRTTIASECKSLVLDLFITKMVENLTDDMKKKREEMLKERTDQVAAALLNPEADRESEASDGFDINDFIVDEEGRLNEENLNDIISMQFGSDSFDSGNDSEESRMISDFAREEIHNSDYNSDDSRMMSDFANEESHDSDFNSDDIRMADDFANEDSHNSDFSSDDSRMMSDFAREDTPDIFGSPHSNDEHFGDEGDELNGSEHSDDENQGSQHSNDDQDMNSNGSGYEDDGSQHSNDEYEGSQRSDDEQDSSQHSDDEHDGSQRSDDEHDGSQRSDEEHEDSQRSDDEYDGSQRSDDEHDGSQRSDDEHDGSQRSDDEQDGSQRSDDEPDDSQRSDDDGSQNSNDEYEGSQQSDEDHGGGNEYNEMEEGDEHDNSGREDDDEYSHDDEGEQSHDEYNGSQHSNDQDSDQNSNDGDQYSNDEQSGNEDSNDGDEDGDEYNSIGRHRYYNLPNYYGGDHY